MFQHDPPPRGLTTGDPLAPATTRTTDVQLSGAISQSRKALKARVGRWRRADMPRFRQYSKSLCTVVLWHEVTGFDVKENLEGR